MRPELLPGDRLLVDPLTPHRSGPRRGELVVFEDPLDRRRWLIKRVAAVAGESIPGPSVPGDPSEVPPDHVFVVAAQPAGRDSRQFGPVSLARVIGTAWYRSAPADRAGPLSA